MNCFEIKTTTVVTVDRIADLFTTMMETSTSWWIRGLKERFAYQDKASFETDNYSFVILYCDPDKDEEDEATGEFTVTYQTIEAALQLMAEKDASWFATVVGDYDSETVDRFFQWMILKDQVYC